MQMNFTQIFQDSINFVRNQQKTFITYSLLLFVTLLICWGLDNLFNQALFSNNVSPQQAITVIAEHWQEYLAIYLVKQLLLILVSTAGLAAVYLISIGKPADPASAFSLAARRVIGVLLLDIVITLPFSLGIASMYTIGTTNSPIPFFALLMFCFGVFLFIRLNLASLHYVVSNDGILASLQKVWMAGIGNNWQLVIYALCIYLVLPLLGMPLTLVSGNLGQVLSALAGGIINIFGVVFSYRFYSLFIKE